MSPQRRTFPPRATGRPSGDDEYPTDTFESVADRTDYDDEPSRAEPTLGSVAASDDDPPTQVFGVISDAAEPPAVAVQLFGEYSGSDDEHDTGVIARVRDDDTDLGVAGPSAAKFRARATASDDAHTEQFAAYRDENEVASQARAAAPATRTSPGLPPVSVPPVPPNATVGLVLPLDTSEQETSEHAPETTPAADETLAPEPVMDKKAAEHAAKDQKAAAREAAKAERLAARAERKAERLAARAERKAAKRPADAATGPDVEAGMDAAPATEDAAAVDTTDPADPDASDPADPDASDPADPDASDPAYLDAPASAAQPTASVGSEVRAVAGPAAEFGSVADAGTGAAAKAETGSETASEIEADDGPPAEHLRAPVLIVVLLLLIAAAGGGAAWVFRDQAVKAAKQHPTTNIALLDKSATAEVIEQVSRAVEAIYSYDAGSLDQSEAQALALISGSYASEFEQNFAAVRALPPQQRASLSSKVVAAGVITLTERRASLLVMVDQVGRQGDKPEPVNAAVRLSVTAQRVDGHWKVSGVNQK